eukprot:Sdes_comp20021_c0_seq1m12742
MKAATATAEQVFTEDETFLRGVMDAMCDSKILVLCVERENAIVYLQRVVADFLAAAELKSLMAVYASLSLGRSLKEKSVIFPEQFCFERTLAGSIQRSRDDAVICSRVWSERPLRGCCQDFGQQEVLVLMMMGPLLSWIASCGVSGRETVNGGYIDILEAVLRHGFRIVKQKLTWLSEEQARHCRGEMSVQLTRSCCLVVVCQRVDAHQYFRQVIMREANF